MDEEAQKKMLDELAKLREEVSALRERVDQAERAAQAAAATEEEPADFGGGEPSWEGAMGRVPDGMVENPAIPPLPDTTAAKDPNALQYKSIDDRNQSPPPGVTQIHDFDEAPLSNTRRIQIVTEAGTGTNPTKLKLVDPDGNADFQTKWMIPLREAGTGGREVKWACIGGEVGLPEGGEGCAPEVTLTPLSGTTAHPNGGIRITVTPCEGTATSEDVWNGNDGATGATGPAGPTGPTGCSVSAITAYYVITTDHVPGTTSMWTPGSTYGPGGSQSVWHTTRPNPTSQFPYLWEYLKVEFSPTGCHADQWIGPYLVGTYLVPHDGCSPVVSPTAQSADGRTLAGTVTGRAWNDQTGQCEDGQTISIYNGRDGAAGANGCTFTPHLSSDGVLSWTNDCSATNPDPLKLTVGLSDQQQFIASIDYLRVDLADNELKLGYTVAQWSAALNQWTYGQAEKAVAVTVC